MELVLGTTIISSFNYQNRLADIQTKLHAYEQRMGVAKPIDLKISKFGRTPCAQMHKNTIKLPSWFLFKYDDIPVRFRIADASDPRIEDPQFLEEFRTWINDNLRASGLSTLCRPNDQSHLKFLIMLMRDPDLYERSKEFTMSHELAHLFHAEREGEVQIMQAIQEAVSIGGIVAGIALIIVAIALIPIAHVLVILGVSALAMTVAVGGFFGWVNRPQSQGSLSGIEEEKMADLDAAKILGTGDGGVHFFQTRILRNLALRRQGLASVREIDSQGNYLLDTGHPKLSERVEYLRNWRPN